MTRCSLPLSHPGSFSYVSLSKPVKLLVSSFRSLALDPDLPIRIYLGPF